MALTRIRTRIAVTGFTEAEARKGIPYLLEEFGQRPWFLNCDAKWVAQGSKLVISVESEADSLAVLGEVTGAHLDEVWDCVIACVEFSSDGIRFEVEDSQVVDLDNNAGP